MNAGTERLPWLVEPLPQPMARTGTSLWPAVASLALIVILAAGAVGWMLARETSGETAPVLTQSLPDAAPEVRPVSPQPAPVPELKSEVSVMPMEARPTAAPPRLEPVRTEREMQADVPTEALPEPGPDNSAQPIEAPAAAGGGRAIFPADEAPAAVPQATGPRTIVLRHPQPWRGRAVQLGAFPSPTAANRVWRGLALSYPYLAAKPKAVSPVDVRDPRTGKSTRMYRLQLATASQAQSAVICQQLARAWRNCTVVY